MSRSYLFFLPLLFLPESSQQRGETGPDMPNIIFLLTDDQRDNTLGMMGHPWVDTPGLDRLISEGIRMANWKYIRMYKGIEGYLEKDLDFRNRAHDFEQETYAIQEKP